MAYELRDNSGSLFLNSKKEKETHPDRTGTAMIDGVTYYVSGWLKKSQSGQQFLSLAFKRKEEQQRKDDRSASMMSPQELRDRRKSEMNDDIPF